VTNKPLAMILLTFTILLNGCADTTSRSCSVYLLMDTPGNHGGNSDRQQPVIRYLLGTLQPGDSLAVARIDGGSFSQKDIVAKMSFDRRLSIANQQKRLFRKKVDQFFASEKGSRSTDVSGGILQAVTYLHKTGAGHEYILILSDLKEELAGGHVLDFPIQLGGCKIIWLNVIGIQKDSTDAGHYSNWLKAWEKRIKTGGGQWQVVNDLKDLGAVLAGQKWG
jgi:hypothetical protein